MKTLFAYTNQMTIVAIAPVLTGLLLRYLIVKRRFERRGIAGLQYRTYKQALLTAFWERVVNILATLLIGAGVILFPIR